MFAAAHCAQLIDFLALPSAFALFRNFVAAQSKFIFRFVTFNFWLRPESERLDTGYLRGVCGLSPICLSILAADDPYHFADLRFSAPKKPHPVLQCGSCHCFKPVARCEPPSQQSRLSTQRSFEGSGVGPLRYDSRAWGCRGLKGSLSLFTKQFYDCLRRGSLLTSNRWCNPWTTCRVGQYTLGYCHLIQKHCLPIELIYTHFDRHASLDP